MTVEAEEPTTSDVVVAVTVAVVPVIVMGNCVDLPVAVAVMVAVRLETFDVPDENVTVALPVASLVVDEAERTPVSAENETGTPDTTALDVSVTVATIVVVLLLSAAIDVGVALNVMAFAVGVGVVGAVVVDDELEPPPPQAASMERNVKAVSPAKARDQMDFNLYSCDDG